MLPSTGKGSVSPHVGGCNKWIQEALPGCAPIGAGGESYPGDPGFPAYAFIQALRDARRLLPLADALPPAAADEAARLLVVLLRAVDAHRA